MVNYGLDVKRLLTILEYKYMPSLAHKHIEILNPISLCVLFFFNVYRLVPTNRLIGSKPVQTSTKQAHFEKSVLMYASD